MTLKKIAFIGLIGFFFMLYNYQDPLFARPQTEMENEDSEKPAQPKPSVPSVGQKDSGVDDSKDEEPADEKAEADVKDAGKKDVVKKELTAPAPVLEIKRLESEQPSYSIELRNVELSDLFRVIAHDYNLNILVDKDIKGKITASFTNISLEEALEGIAEISNLVVEKKGSIIRVSPHLVTKMVVLKYIQAKKLLEAAKAAQGAQSKTVASPAGNAALPAEAKKEESTIYDLISEKGKILLGQLPNSIIIIDYPPNAAQIEDYLKQIDQRMTSKIFKMKYLKASDIVGVVTTAGSSTSTGTTSSSGSASSSSSATTTN
ncbi:MAG: secretin and TonB N-terminal domain-containing protein [Candidatus Omnitrophota bacterium]|jgi:type II secretory pathway component GspD/PulD (secretin)